MQKDWIMHIHRLNRLLEAKYERFVAAHRGSLLYHQLRFRDFLVDLLGCRPEYLLAVADSQVRGILPLMRSRDGDVLNALPFFGSNAGILSVEQRAHEALLRAYNDVAITAKASTLITNPFDDVAYDGISYSCTDQRISQFTRITADDADREHLMGRFEASARRNVRKAQKEGIIVERDAARIPDLRSIHIDNMAAIGGLRKADAFFELIPAHFTEREHYDLYVARAGEHVVAALLVFYANETVEYYVPAIRADFRSVQPMAGILVEAMRDAALRGFRRWNWGGTWTSQNGVYRFKKKWAAEEQPYTYYVNVSDQTLYHVSPEHLRATYPSFYVLPFSSLKSRAA